MANLKNLTKKIMAVGITGLVVGTGISSVFASSNNEVKTSYGQLNLIELEDSNFMEFDIKDYYKELNLSEKQIIEVESLFDKQENLFEKLDKLYEDNSKEFEKLDSQYPELFDLTNSNYNFDFTKYDKEYESLLEKFGILKINEQINDLDLKINEILGEQFIVDEFEFEENEELTELFNKIDKIVSENQNKFDKLENKYFSDKNKEISDKQYDKYYNELLELEKSLGIDKLDDEISKIYDLENLDENYIYGFENSFEVDFEEDFEGEFVDSFETDLNNPEFEKLDKQINKIYENNSKKFEDLDSKYNKLEKEFDLEFEKISDKDFEKDYEKLNLEFDSKFEKLDKQYQDLEDKTGLSKLFEKFESLFTFE